MIQLTERIFVGGSSDEAGADLAGAGVTAVLCVAQDLQPTRGWRQDVEYMHVGLIDGPGNPPEAYAAAVLALSALLRRHKRVLVCCHACSRSVATIVMYLDVLGRRGWDATMRMLEERVDLDLPEPHEVHREAHAAMDWRFATSLLENR